MIVQRSRRAAHDGKEALTQEVASGPEDSVGPPDLDRAKSAVLNSLSFPDEQRGYTIDEFIECTCNTIRL